jgi:hypothetical protein
LATDDPQPAEINEFFIVNSCSGGHSKMGYGAVSERVDSAYSTFRKAEPGKNMGVVALAAHQRAPQQIRPVATAHKALLLSTTRPKHDHKLRLRYTGRINASRNQAIACLMNGTAYIIAVPIENIIR